VATVVIVITLATWFLKAVLSKDDKLTPVPVQSFIGVLGLFFLIFTFTSIINAQSRAVVIGQLLRRTNLLLLYVVLVAMIRDREHLQKAIWFLLGALVVVSFMGLYELITEIPILTYAGIKANIADTAAEGFRIIGPTGDPDFHTVAMNLGAGISLTYFYIYRSARLRVLLAFFFLLFVLNILGSGSRGGLVAFLAIVGVFWFFIRLKHKWFLAIGTVAIMVLVCVGLLMYQSGGVGRYTGKTGGKTIGWRIGWSEMGLAMYKTHPIIGIGTGNFTTLYHKYSVPVVPKEPKLAHNSFIQVLVENGILGFIPYISIYVVALGSLWGVMRYSEDRRLHALGVAFFAITIGFGLFALTSNILENEDYWLVFAFSVITAYVFRQERKARALGAGNLFQEVGADGR